MSKRFVDKLVRVTRLTGQEDWIYIHLEVQGTAQGEFAERMFVYNYRIYDRYRRPVASMAVLADDSANWKPQEFGFEVLGCKHTLQFPVAKLLDVVNLEQEKKMAYVSTGERIGIEKGLQQGLQQGEALALQKLLSKRFGVIPAEIVGQISSASASTEQIDEWLDLVLDAPSMDAMFGSTRH